MNKKSRKSERRLLRQQKALDDFRRYKEKLSDVTKLPSDQSLIPQAAPINPLIDEVLERHVLEDNFKIIFAKYNFKCCELNKLNDSRETRNLIELFNRITVCNHKLLPSSGIVRDNVHKSEQYSYLFDTIPPDAELKESKFSQEGRLFFYIYKNYFCVISIKAKHL